MHSLQSRIDSAKAWGILSNHPVMVYHDNINEYMVYWNGYIMTRRIGLTIAASMKHKIVPTTKMREALYDDAVMVEELGGYVGVDFKLDSFGALGMMSYLLEHVSERREQNFLLVKPSLRSLKRIKPSRNKMI
jgi:hypothetical protein